MPRPPTSNGVTRLASGRWRWRVMVGGVRHTGVEDTEAAARLARLEAEWRALDARAAHSTDSSLPTESDR